MATTSEIVKHFITKFGFIVALMIVIAFGYVLGKDRAIRDNARDEACSKVPIPAASAQIKGNKT